MLSELLKKYLDENVKEGDPHFAILWQLYGAISARDQEESDETADEGQTLSEMEVEAMNLVSHFFDTAWDIVNKKTAKWDYSVGPAISLTSIMMDYIKSKQRIEALSPLLEYFEPKASSDMNVEEVIKKAFNAFLDTPFSDFCAEREKATPANPSEKHVDVEYEKQEEKIVTADDFINKDEKEKPNICLHSIINFQKAMQVASGGSLSMDVLCYDEMGHLGQVKVVTQVLYVIEELSENHLVCRTVKKAESGGPVTKIGLLISS